jgi:hypothetical protein
MTRRFLSLPVLLILTAVFGYSQIGIGIPGIGFPGSRRYPQQGGPYPGSGQNQVPTTSFVGMLRSLSNDSSGSASSNTPYTTLVLETDDRRIVTVSLQKRTKYIGTSGGSARITDFQPGDHIEVDATQDNSDIYRAVKVTQLRQGTAEERAEASQPIDGSGSASRGGSTGSSAGDDDPDRPRLHRAASSDGDNTSSTASSASNSSAGSASSASDNDPDRPRMRRAAASDGDSTPQAQITPGDPPRRSSAPASPDPDDPGPPTLARGRQASRSASPSSSSSSGSSGDSGTLIAGSRPSIQAQDVNGVTRPPAAPVVDDRPVEDRAVGDPNLAPTGDPVIDMAREEAFSFSETLPNYVVKQFTTRYVTEVARNRGTSWRALDTITADLVYQDGKESYKNFLVNGRVSRDAPEKSGSWSSGEFASTLQDIMSPITNAEFHGKRTTTIVNRAAYRYDFSVEQQNSHWHIEASGQFYQPAYTGSVWIDKDNYRVLRIELSARDMPRSFPLDQVESSVDYDYVLIGDQKYLLPSHSEALSCLRGTSDCSRNTIEFRNYKKFGAETNIIFDTPDTPGQK